MAILVYRAQETTIQFSDTDGDYAITLANLAANTGRFSTRADRGAGSKPARYKWRASFQFNTTPAVLDSVYVLLGQSDGTYADGNLATTDGALTWYPASNLDTIGQIEAQAATAATSFVASGTCWIMERYFQVGVFNESIAALVNTNNVNRIIMTPMPVETQ